MSLFADDPELSLLPDLPAHLKCKVMLQDVPESLVRDASKLQILTNSHAGLLRLCRREGDSIRVYEVNPRINLGYLGTLPAQVSEMYGTDYHPVVYNHYYLGIQAGYQRTDLRVWLAAGPPSRVVTLELVQGLHALAALPIGEYLGIRKQGESLIVTSSLGDVGVVAQADAFEYLLWLRRTGYVGESLPAIFVGPAWRLDEHSGLFQVRLCPIAAK